jgi:hypothetical protein
MKTTEIQNLIRICILLLFMLASACGYRFVGEGELPAGIRRVCITMLENRTAETGAETLFTNDLIEEFSQNPALTVTTDKDGADAFLSGTIESLTLRTVSRRSSHTPLEREAKITVSLKLTGSDGTERWSGKKFSAVKAYGIMSDKIVTEYSRGEAMSDISKRIAETAYEHFISNFQ